MAFMIRFAPRGMTREQYEEIGRKLDEQGGWPPEGMLAHVGFATPGGLHVSEVWESREQQEQYAQRLMPVLEELNIDLPTQPDGYEVAGYVFREASGRVSD